MKTSFVLSWLLVAPAAFAEEVRILLIDADSPVPDSALVIGGRQQGTGTTLTGQGIACDGNWSLANAVSGDWSRGPRQVAVAGPDVGAEWFDAHPGDRLSEFVRYLDPESMNQDEPVSCYLNGALHPMYSVWID